jgi:hypothetical protein
MRLCRGYAALAELLRLLRVLSSAYCFRDLVVAGSRIALRLPPVAVDPKALAGRMGVVGSLDSRFSLQTIIFFQKLR